MKFLYLLLNIFTISVPLIRSFEPRIKFISRWKSLGMGILLPMILFIVWDVLFTHWGVWGFNEKYLSGLRIINLPLEEWLFFITVPYACIFIYEVMNFFVRKDFLKSVAPWFSVVLVVILLYVGFTNSEKAYTSITFIGAALYLSFLLLMKADYLGRFFLGYFVALIPFFLVNGVLTGSFIPEEVVWYNDAENLGIRLGTIPVEDSIYMMLLLLMNVSVYEYLNGRYNYPLVRKKVMA
jgi:lycopene cyclase domain-containing protein